MEVIDLCDSDQTAVLVSSKRAERLLHQWIISMMLNRSLQAGALQMPSHGWPSHLVAERESMLFSPDETCGYHAGHWHLPST